MIREVVKCSSSPGDTAAMRAARYAGAAIGVAVAELLLQVPHLRPTLLRWATRPFPHTNQPQEAP